MMPIYQGTPVILVLMDVSAAFDTVDHNVLFFRLKDMFGLLDKVLELFRSYQEQCSQRVSVHGVLSDVQFLLSGVPQGSVLWCSQCIPVLLGSLRSDMGLNINCILMTHSCIYHWILTMS